MKRIIDRAPKRGGNFKSNSYTIKGKQFDMPIFEAVQLASMEWDDEKFEVRTRRRNLLVGVYARID